MSFLQIVVLVVFSIIIYLIGFRAGYKKSVEDSLVEIEKIQELIINEITKANISKVKEKQGKKTPELGSRKDI